METVAGVLLCGRILFDTFLPSMLKEDLLHTKKKKLEGLQLRLVMEISDGASAGAVLLMKRSVALKKGLPILGVFRCGSCNHGHRSCCCKLAIPAAVKSAGLCITICRKKLQLDPQKVNVNGGSIAIGHPLGLTGARCVAILLHEMKRRGKDSSFGVVSMCIGSSMGAAAVFERGD